MNRKEQYKHHRDLAARAQKGDKFAANELVREFEPFILSIVRHRVTGYSLDKDDLIQIARMGLMHAIKKWDPNRNVAFISYAGQWIRSYVQRHVERDSSPITISYGVLGKAIVADRHNKIEEIKDPLVLEANKLLRSTFRSLNHKSNIDNDGIRYDELVGDDRWIPQDEKVELNDRSERVNEAISNLVLNEKEKAILRCRLMMDPPMPLTQISKRFKFSCSGPYLFQVEQKLIAKLAAALGREFPWIIERSELVNRTQISLEKRAARDKKNNAKRAQRKKEQRAAAA